MKGVILAGGLGTRLMPLTKVTNKHLLPVFNKPMIFYPIEKMKEAGIKKIMIVTGCENAGDFMKLLGSGKEFGVELTYRIQDGAGGIAEALGLAEDFAGDEKILVILGDNIFEDNLKDSVEKFEKSEYEAMIFLKEVNDPERFGVAEVKGDKIISIEEKPKHPKSNLITVGIYMYSPNVFEIIKTLKPSWRNELEITDVNNIYLKRGTLTWAMLKGFWSDAGTFDSLMRASIWLRDKNESSNISRLF
jgi:glucose-1-phosphate thymidylyltransferase